MSPFTISILSVITIVIIILFFFFFHKMQIKRKNERLYTDITKIFDDIKAQKDNFSYEKSYINGCDYILTTSKYKYYVKVIKNFNEDDICINSALKWNFGKALCSNKSKDVKENVDLIRLDLQKEKNGKKPRKLFIIYPSAKSILMIVNECEYEFVDSSTDVYGNNIVTYENLKKDFSQAIDF